MLTRAHIHLVPWHGAKHGASSLPELGLLWQVWRRVVGALRTAKISRPDPPHRKNVYWLPDPGMILDKAFGVLDRPQKGRVGLEAEKRAQNVPIGLSGIPDSDIMWSIAITIVADERESHPLLHQGVAGLGNPTPPFSL